MRRNKVRTLENKVDYHFRCQPKADTRDGKLLRYLQLEDTEFPVREMVLNALSAFWMPFAHKYFKDLPPEELQKSVDRAIYQLQMQIIYLQEDFGSRRIASLDVYFQTQELTPKMPGQTQLSALDIEPSNAKGNSNDEMTIPAPRAAGEWQDLNF